MLLLRLPGGNDLAAVDVAHEPGAQHRHKGGCQPADRLLPRRNRLGAEAPERAPLLVQPAGKAPAFGGFGRGGLREHLAVPHDLNLHHPVLRSELVRHITRFLGLVREDHPHLVFRRGGCRRVNRRALRRKQCLHFRRRGRRVNRRALRRGGCLRFRRRGCRRFRRRGPRRFRRGRCRRVRRGRCLRFWRRGRRRFRRALRSRAGFRLQRVEKNHPAVVRAGDGQQGHQQHPGQDQAQHTFVHSIASSSLRVKSMRHALSNAYSKK